MDNKTKNKIEEIQKIIEDNRSELRKMQDYESKRKCADELFTQFTAFMDAGFTDAQAWELVFEIVKKAK